VKRGKWILENLFDAPPPEAPPDVPQLADGDSAQLTGSLREQMEKHRADPACASCHKMMDPLGFGLENYDAIGAWRDRDGTVEIDATGELPSGQTFDGPHELRRLLLQRQDDFRRCLSEKMLTFALGRGLEYYDACAVERIVNRLQSDDDRFAIVVEEIIKSPAFRQRESETSFQEEPSCEALGSVLHYHFSRRWLQYLFRLQQGMVEKKNHCGWHLCMHPTASI
jgi:hypothetical protein